MHELLDFHAMIQYFKQFGTWGLALNSFIESFFLVPPPDFLLIIMDLAKPEKAETKTASGIIIPDAAQEKTQTAVIEAVGPGTDKEKITVKVGERVMYDKYAGTSVKIDGEEYLILKNSDIIAVIEN